MAWIGINFKTRQVYTAGNRLETNRRSVISANFFLEAAPALISINTPCSTIMEHFGIILAGLAAGAAQNNGLCTEFHNRARWKCIRRIFDYCVL